MITLGLSIARKVKEYAITDSARGNLVFITVMLRKLENLRILLTKLYIDQFNDRLNGHVIILEILEISVPVILIDVAAYGNHLGVVEVEVLYA